MRTAILSDIHANIEALTAVIAEARRLGAERFVCLGDCVGYGASPNEVCELLRATCDAAVIGNHDSATIGRTDDSGYHDLARVALAWTRTALNAENRAWLAALPYTVRQGDVELVHGSPLDPPGFEYLFHVNQTWSLVAAFDRLARVTFIGHSHLTVSFSVTRTAAQLHLVTRLEQQRDGTPQKLVCTVGSVGQPRDRDPRSCFVVHDDATGIIDWHRVAYDVEGSGRRIRAAGLPPVFAERLVLGL